MHARSGLAYVACSLCTHSLRVGYCRRYTAHRILYSTSKWLENWSSWPEAVSANSEYTREGTVQWRLFEDPKSAARRITQSVWDRWEAGLTPAPAALTRYQADNYAASRPTRSASIALPSPRNIFSLPYRS